MLDALAEAEAKEFAGIPDNLLEREQQLRIDLGYYANALRKKSSKAQTATAHKSRCGRIRFSI
jgi:hypothetical protein